MSDTWKQSKDHALIIGIMVIAILVIQIGIGLGTGVIGGGLADTDPYMWLNRAHHLYETGNWFQTQYPRIDPPFGYEQHWTRLFDLILISGGIIGGSFVGFDTALYHWALYLTPLFQILTLIALTWALAPWYRAYGDAWSIGVLPAIFVTQIPIIATFLIGHTDHQILIVLLFVVLIGLTVRLLVLPFRTTWAYGAGVTAALGVWVSVEFLPAIFVSIAVLFLIWLRGDSDASRKLFTYSLSLFIASFAVMLIQRGHLDFSTPLIDQISIVHLTLFGLLLLVCVATYAVDRLSGEPPAFGKRVVLLTFGGLVSVTTVVLIYPALLSGPWGNLDTLYAGTHLRRIGELQPVLDVQNLPEEWLSQLGRFSLWLGIALPAIPVLIIRTRKSLGDEQKFWAYLTLGAVVYVPLAALQIRWTQYATLFLIPAYAWLANQILLRAREWPNRPIFFLGRALLILALLLWFLLPIVVSGVTKDPTRASQSRTTCKMLPLSRYLDTTQVWTERPKNIMAFIDLGPALLYYSPHSVYSIPSHRYHQGFGDSYNLMAAVTDDEARELIEKRNVELILICKSGPEQGFFNRDDDEDTFHARLSRDAYPAWLSPVALPSELAEVFSLYEVRRR